MGHAELTMGPRENTNLEKITKCIIIALNRYHKHVQQICLQVQKYMLNI